MKTLKEIITIEVYSDGTTTYDVKEVSSKHGETLKQTFDKQSDIKKLDVQISKNVSSRVRQILLVILDMKERYEKDLEASIKVSTEDGNIEFLQENIYFEESFKKSINKVASYLNVKEQTVIDKFARNLEYVLSSTILTIKYYITGTEKDNEFIKNGKDLSLSRLLVRNAPAQGYKSYDLHEINKFIRAPKFDNDQGRFQNW